jgi:hypothetical protein
VASRLDAGDVARLPARVRRLIGPSLAAPKRHKHRAIPTVVDGIKFQSTKEGARWVELQRLERARQIHGLERQVEFPLDAMDPAGDRVTVSKYVADFVYNEGGTRIVEDVKGRDRRSGKFRTTEAYRLKRAWLRAQYGIVIRET